MTDRTASSRQEERLRQASAEALDTLEKLAADLREEDADRHAQRRAVIEIDIIGLRAALSPPHAKDAADV